MPKVDTPDSNETLALHFKPLINSEWPQVTKADVLQAVGDRPFPEETPIYKQLLNDLLAICSDGNPKHKN